MKWDDQEVERWHRESEREESMRFARGFLFGTAISVVLWLIIVAAVIAAS